MTTTWTQDSHFAAVSGCAVSGGSVAATPFDHADLSGFNTSLAGAWPFNDHAEDVIGAMDGTPAGSPSYATGARGNGIQLNGSDQYVVLPDNAYNSHSQGTVSMWVYFSTRPASGSYYGLFDAASDTSDQRWMCLFLAGKSASDTRLLLYVIDTSIHSIECNTNIAPNAWHHIVMTSDGSTWKFYVDGVLQTITPTGTNSGAWFNFNALGNTEYQIGRKNRYGSPGYYCNAIIDEVAIWSDDLDQAAITALYDSGTGRFVHGHTAEFTVGDDGETADAGNALLAWDDAANAAATASANASLSVAVDDDADDSGWDGYSAYLAWTGAAGSFPHANGATRYRRRRFRMSSSDGRAASFDALSSATYSTDTTPPGVPTSTKLTLFESDNYALIWTEPSDLDFDHCELRRIAGGTTEYLNNTMGFANWLAVSMSPFTFSSLDYEKDSRFAHFIDTDVSAESVAYSVRSVDTTGNASAWTAFTASTGADAPAAPSLSVLDHGDGTATFTVSESDTGTSNAIAVRTISADAWTALGTVVGNDSLTAGVDDGWHLCKVESTGTGGTTCGDIVQAWFGSGAGPGFDELRIWLRGRLTAHDALVALLPNADAIRADSPDAVSVVPGVLVGCAWREDTGYDAPGVYDAHITLRLLAATHDELDALSAAVADCLDGASPSTATWSGRALRREEDETDARDESTRRLTRTLRYRTRLFRDEA